MEEEERQEKGTGRRNGKGRREKKEERMTWREKEGRERCFPDGSGLAPRRHRLQEFLSAACAPQRRPRALASVGELESIEFERILLSPAPSPQHCLEARADNLIAQLLLQPVTHKRGPLSQL